MRGLDRLRRRGRPERVLFACAGGTGAWPGMATDLYAAEPAFRASIDAACPIVADHCGYDPLPAFRSGEPAPAKRDEIILLGLVQLGQVALWLDAGVEPDGAIGVSLGEVTAAYVAGGLTFEDAVRAACACASGSHEGEERCRFFSVEASAEQAVELIDTAPVAIDLLGTTSPRIAMLLTAAEDEDAARAHIAATHTILKERPSTRPHHTTRRPSSLPRMERELAGIRPLRPPRACYLASCGRDVQGDAVFDARFWAWMISHPYLLGQAAAAALDGPPSLVVQIGAEPSLSSVIAETARITGARAENVETMRPGAPAPDTWARARDRALRRLRRATPAPPPSSAPEREPVPDLDDPEVLRDPGPALAALRARGPIHRSLHGRWVVTDTALIEEALTRPNEFSNRFWADKVDFTLLGADPPEHTPVRRLVAPLLGPSAVDPLAETAAAVAREVVEPLAARHEVDVVRDVAEPVVRRTVARLLDIDAEELGRHPQPHPVAEGDPPLARLQRAYNGLPSRPGVAERLPLEERARASLVKLLWFGGTLTTIRHLGWAVLELDRHPDLRAGVAAGGDEMDAFLDEVLRLHPPEMLLHRETAADAPLGDEVIPEGARVALAIGAANRDPARYEEPDRIRLDRPPRGSHTFGHGPHRCPGSRLSRHMSRAALRALLDAMPDHRVTQPDAALHHVASPGHGLAGLAIAPVR